MANVWLTEVLKLMPQKARERKVLQAFSLPEYGDTAGDGERCKDRHTHTHIYRPRGTISHFSKGCGNPTDGSGMHSYIPVAFASPQSHHTNEREEGESRREREKSGCLQRIPPFGKEREVPVYGQA